MTTCFAYFVRGDFSSAARANLAGVVFAAACALLIPWCLWSAYRGRLWQVSDPIPFVCVLVSCLAGVTGGLWVLRLIAELA